MRRLALRTLRLSSGIAAVAAVAAVTACGGISDPTRAGEHVATLSGALTSTSAAVPAGAHVALVWRNGTTGALVVGADAPIVGSQFSMTLDPPPDAYLTAFAGDVSFATATNGSNSVAVPPQSGTNPVAATDAGAGPVATATADAAASSNSGSNPNVGPTPSGPHGASVPQLRPADVVGGGIAPSLQVAVAGFVVYVDANANGALDLVGTAASSPDQVVGSASDLVLTYLAGGGALDYEKLRDKSGILPTAGFDLAWTEGRWVPLSEVELVLGPSPKLPQTVCNGTDNTAVTVSDAADGGAPGNTDVVDAGIGEGASPYPSPTDPNLQCAPDGRSFTYTMVSNCPLPPPEGLCSYDYAIPCAPPASYSSALASGAPVPADWPCAIPETADASTSAGN